MTLDIILCLHVKKRKRASAAEGYSLHHRLLFIHCPRMARSIRCSCCLSFPTVATHTAWLQTVQRKRVNMCNN